MTSFYRRRHILRKSHNSVVSFKGSILYTEERMVMNGYILDTFISIRYISFHYLVSGIIRTLLYDINHFIQI